MDIDILWNNPHGEDGGGMVRVTAINDPTTVYYGKWGKRGPHGLGAITKDNVFYKGGEWIDGKLLPEYEMSEEECNSEMNRIVNRPHVPHW